MARAISAPPMHSFTPPNISNIFWRNRGRRPPKSEVTRHLDRIYFLLQQAGFCEAERRPNAAKIAAFARQYYQKALRAADGADLRAADEGAKSAEDLMRALENLAQATASLSPPPPLR